MIEVKNLSVTYHDGAREIEALKDVSIDLKMGKTVALVGESGSGKTTLMMAILGLLPHNCRIDGTINFGGRDILTLQEEELSSYRWDQISLVPQGAMNSLTPVMTVGAHIEEVLKVHGGISKRDSQPEVKRLLQEVSLKEEVAKRYPHELSGGQKQRVAIALALACAPYFLLADEPTTALDVITQAEIVLLLEELVKKRGMGMALVTHDIALASTFCDSMAVMYEGRIVERGSVKDILKTPSHAHTRDLIGSIEELNI